MPKKANSDIKAMAAKQARQQEQLAAYKKQRQWLTWAAITIAILVLLLIATWGYASNWWLGNATRTSSFTPASQEPDTTSTTNPASTTTNGGTSTTGGGGGTTTTNNSTTTNTSTTTTNTKPSPTSSLIDFLNSTHVGDTVNSTLDRARALGLHASCHTEVLVVQVCEVSDDNGNTVTTKNLLSGDGLTGVTANF